MPSYDIITLNAIKSHQKRQPSENLTIDFNAVRVGPSNLIIQEDAGAISFGNNPLKDATSIEIGASGLEISEIGGGFSFDNNTIIDVTSIEIGNSGLKISETSGAFSFASKVLSNVALPVVGTDVANKNYVDGVAQGLDIKESVKAATTALLPSYTASGGPGVNRILTADANGVLTLDGVSTWTDIDTDGAVNDPFPSSGTAASRVLVKNESSAGRNGIYAVKDKGTGGTPFILIRAIDFDEDNEVTAGAFTFVTEGTTLADTGWVLATNDPISVDANGLTFVQFSGAGAFTGGDGIDISGTVISTDLSTTSGLEFSSGELQVDLQAAGAGAGGLELSGNEIKVDAGNGIELTAAGVAVLANITETSTTESSSVVVAAGGVSIAVDDSTIEGSGQGSAGAENLRVKDAGITESHIASSSLGNGLTGGSGTTLSVVPNITETSTTESSSVVVAAGGVSIAVDDSTIEGSGQGVAGAENLRVKDAGITESHIASSSLGNGLTGGSGTTLSVVPNITETSTTESSSVVVAAGGVSIAVDDSTIEGSGQGSAGAENLRVKDAGITETHLNTSVAGDGITGGAGTALSVDYSQAFTNDNAGAITIRQVVYIKADGDVDLAKNDITDLDNYEIGLVEDASISAAASGEIIIRKGAVVGGYSGFTPGRKQYVSDSTAGNLVDNLSGFAAGEHVYCVGRAVSATELLFDPKYEFVF